MNTDIYKYYNTIGKWIQKNKFDLVLTLWDGIIAIIFSGIIMVIILIGLISYKLFSGPILIVIHLSGTIFGIILTLTLIKRRDLTKKISFLKALKGGEITHYDQQR